MSERCKARVGWTVTWNWLGTAKHEYHRCTRDAGHAGAHLVRAKNYSWLRRPFGRGSQPARQRGDYLEW